MAASGWGELKELDELLPARTLEHGFTDAAVPAGM